MSRRTERLGSLVRRVVADEIQNNLNDPRIATFTSVTRVEVSPDLSVAHVHVSVMGDAKEGHKSLRALQHAAGYIHTVLGRELRVRQVPRVVFKLDESLKRGFEVVQMIDREIAALDAGDAAAVEPDPDTDVQEAS